MSAAAIRVIKVGGSILEPEPSAGLVAGLAARRTAGEPVIVVHGGGKALTGLAARLGLESRFVNGLRVTDAAMLQTAVMALAGEVNTRLVGALAAAGVPAVGLTGLDAMSVGARIENPELGAVGAVTSAEAGLWRALLAAGYMPVVASLAAGEDGRPLNVNADSFAAAVAAACGAARLEFHTDVAGVLDAGGKCLSSATLAELEALSAAGAIRGGMLPKAAACAAALRAGVGAVCVGATRINL